MADEKPLNTAEQAWDAAQYEAALAHLERLQEQLDSLRTTLPSIIAPLARRNVSKPQLFAEIKQAAIGSTTDVQAFRDNWKSEQTQEIIAKATESLQKNDDLSKADDVPRYGWSEQN